MKERFQAVLVVLSGPSLDTHRRVFQSDCSCGAEPRPARLLWPCPFHLIFNLSHEIYTYRPLIRAVIIHYDAKV